MFRLFKRVFLALLSFNRSKATMTNATNLKASISLNSQPFMTRPTITDLNPDEYNRELHYYPFMVN